MFLVFVLIIIFFLVHLYFKNCFLFWKNKNVYSEATVVPFGNAKAFIFRKITVAAEFQRLYHECCKKSLSFCGFYFFTKPILVLADLDLIEKITKMDFDHFTDRVFHSSDVDPLSLHLAALEGSRWRVMRNKLAPVFTPSRIKLMYETIEKCGIELVSQMHVLASRNECVEMKEMGARYSVDVLVNSAFGLECKTVKNQNMEYVSIAKSFFSTSLIDGFMRLIKMLNPNIYRALNLKSTKPEFEKFFVNTVETIIRNRENNAVVKKDLMHTLLQIRNNVEIEEDKIGTVQKTNGTKLSLSVLDIAAQSFVFFMAGFEPSSTTITFCLYELALNTHYQDKLRKEVEQALEKNDGEFSYDLLMGLTFTQKCIKETLRKYPPLAVLTRECTKDYKIPSLNVTLEKGTTVSIPVLGVHYDPNIYVNPEEFDPEKFSEENCAKRHHTAFLSFGFGPRNCIGHQMGYLQCTVAIAFLIRDFKFKINSSTKVPLVMDTGMFVTRSKDEVLLDIEKIER